METRSVTCPYCTEKFRIKSRAKGIQRHFAVQKNSQGVMEFELEVPTGFTVPEWVISDIGTQDRMVLSLFGGTCITVPYVLMASYTTMDIQGVMITGIAVLGLASTVSMLVIEYLYSEHNKAARWLKNQHIKAMDITPDISDSNTIKLEVQDRRKESQANMKAYRFVDGLNITPEQFSEWAFEVIENGKSLALSKWIGKGNPFSRAQYDDFMNKLSAANMVINRNGWQLTRGGRSAITAYVKGA